MGGAMEADRTPEEDKSLILEPASAAGLSGAE
jgi:hypothetical protein